MTAGNALRKETQRNDALAMLGVSALREYRETNSGEPVLKTCYCSPATMSLQSRQLHAAETNVPRRSGAESPTRPFLRCSSRRAGCGDRISANLASVRVPAASHRALGPVHSGDHAW